MKRKTVFIGLGILALLLFVGIAAGRITEEAKETMQDRRGGMRGFGGKGNGEFERGHGMHGPREMGDLDNDSIPNCEDLDDDGDGINDTEDEYPHDHDNDGIPDFEDDDDDNDGILDSDDEYYVGNCPEGERPPPRRPHGGMKERIKQFMYGDLDNDSIANCEDPDDDGDGINDTQDEFPHDHDNDGIPDGKDDDDDNDGIPDIEDDYYVGNTPERKGPKEMRDNQCKGPKEGGRGGKGGRGGGGRR